jgi:hypothetical protein
VFCLLTPGGDLTELGDYRGCLSTFHFALSDPRRVLQIRQTLAATVTNALKPRSTSHGWAEVESLAVRAGVGAFSERRICKGGEQAKRKQYTMFMRVAGFRPRAS